MKTNIKLTVLFEGIFWVGIFERAYEEKYEVSRVVFGSEPKDYEIYDFVLKNFYNLGFSKSLSLNETSEVENKKINPKRLQKEIKKEIENKGIGTKAQRAMKLQYEESKMVRNRISKEEKEAEKEKKFELKQEKKLKKHKGH